VASRLLINGDKPLTEAREQTNFGWNDTSGTQLRRGKQKEGRKLRKDPAKRVGLGEN